MTIVPALLALALAAPPDAGASPAATAKPSPELRARVVALLGAIDRPISADAFRRLGPEGEVALADIALSGDFPAYRARSLEALAALRAARAEELHRRLARDATAPAPVRRAAVRGLARLVDPSRAAAELSGFVAGDPDPTVRAAAAGALARAAPADGCAVIRRQAAREPAATRAAFRRALAACERSR
jgi:HEAT repeat protein